MTIDLPPRRKLPADVKDRMRPEFTEARTRRNHTPLAVAAGVALLIAGGLVLTQSAGRDVEPGRDRVVAPSSRDLDRCRVALNDPNWSSTAMVVFGLRKVLVGTDGRFCELTRAQAGVAPPGFQPTQLEAGSITYRSSHIIAGVPPLGAQKAKAREGDPNNRRGSSASVVTPDFYVVHVQPSMYANELVFDDRAFAIPRFTSWSAEGITESFESGDANPQAPVNLLGKCVDHAFNNNTMSTEELQGWEPLQVSGPDGRPGLLLAHRAHREWATCTFSGAGPSGLSPIRTDSDDPDATRMVGGYQTGNEFVMIGRTNRSAKTVELQRASPVTAEVTDGHFIVRLFVTIGETFSPDRERIVARNARNEIVYEGGIR